MIEKTYFKGCPNCKAEGTIKGIYTSTNQGERVQIKKCTKCKHQVGLKQFEKLKELIQKQNILDTISDLCSNFLYYDRKEDESLSMEQLNKAVEDNVVTVDEMVSEFRKNLENTFH